MNEYPLDFVAAFFVTHLIAFYGGWIWRSVSHAKNRS